MATNKIRFTIVRLGETDEWWVRKFENNRPVTGASYFTDNEMDARSTMLQMVARVTDTMVYHSIKQTSKNSITITTA